MSDGILVRFERDPLYGLSADELIAFLLVGIADRADQAYLFGSFVSSDFSRHSDLDLLIVCETDIPFVERPSLFGDLRTRVPSLDILVYTPDEFARIMADPTAGFWRSFAQTSRRIL